MQKLHFSIQINAPVEKVWNTMLGQDTYPEWTSAFNPGSRYEGDWEQGSKILFVGPDPEGKTGEGGMIGKIKENRKHEFVSIEYTGMIANGVEDTTSEQVKKWIPSFENYTFTEKDGGTELQVNLEIPDDFKDMFADMWPKGLQKLKEISER